MLAADDRDRRPSPDRPRRLASRLAPEPCRWPRIDWQFTLALVTNGVMIGLMYALIALGFVLIYKATDAINFAQGEFVMFAGFIAAGAGDLAGLPFWPSALLAVVGMVALGFGLERVVLRPLIGRPVIAVIMATIGLAAVLRGFAAAGVRRRHPGDRAAGRRRPDPARAGQAAAGAAGRRRRSAWSFSPASPGSS